MVKDLSGQASPRLHEELQGVLAYVCPGCHHEGVGLQECPETNGGYPEIDILSRFNEERLGKPDTDLDRTMRVTNQGLGATVTEDTVTVQYASGLKHERDQKQGSGQVQVNARKSSGGRKMSPSGVYDEYS